ncbi:siderophore iron transporter mirB [Plectosphaerella cucumerina]|uniref:Siderophore iron transporter mirB n=1 Tax=Plectosphaerella cucumerina TaxID=40658 RepID=A0A8K0TNP4_9PEZI|nr:siderophore iron transporter mirB [Plectosphaerella cucumerina]
MEEEFSKDAQFGVQRVEATAMVWSKAHLITAYVIIWFIYVVISLQEVIVRTYSPFVTSTFSKHSLTAVVGIISSIVSGMSKLPLAKLLDTWGRPQGLALTLFVWVVGIVMMACCRNVETYCAANVFSTVGAQGTSYCLTVFVSDTTTLRNRSLMLALATTPYIFTTWSAGPIANKILRGPGWRWGFGMWAIITPFVVMPLVLLFLWNQRKAEKQGLLKNQSSMRNITPRKVLQYAIDVDLLGIFLLAGGMALFLLPFSIYSYQALRFRSPMIICMIVFGIVLVATFVLWEKFFAPVTFIPFRLLRDRTVFFGGIMFTFVFFCSAVWGSYFTSMLLVAYNQGVDRTTWISNIYRTGSCFFAIPMAYFIRWTGRFKPLALYFLLPLMMLGVSLMIPFRHPDADIGLVVMTQIFVAFAGGPIVLCGEMAMMAPSDHQHIAVIIAILDLFGSVGTALGSTIAAAIWTGTFRDAIIRHAPPTLRVDLVYNNMYSQLANRWGTPERRAIALAYADSQRYMLITSACILVPAFVAVALWRNIDLRTIKQTRGRVI